MSDPSGRLSSQRSYDIEFSVPMVHRLRFTEDCFGQDFDILKEVFEHPAHSPARIQVWVDEGVAQADNSLCDRIATRLDQANGLELVSDVELLPGGERVKNDTRIIDHLLASINRDNLDRRSYIMAIGGGALLDAVGYAAAIAHRGIRLVRLPTSTLAQADSGVGVKNAVNWFGKKNWKGTFATPWAVVNDRNLLHGLSDRDYRCGFSEAVKVALLKNPVFFHFLADNASAIANRKQPYASEAIRQSVLLHLRHITQGGDPFEMLQARPLDFGHWSAHKLEAITDYALRHGEAVAIGIAVDVAYSHLRLGLPSEIAEQTISILQNLHLPIWDVALTGEAVFDGLEEFRQHLGGQLTITLVEDLGYPRDVHSIERSVMREAISWVAGKHNLHSVKAI
ncbi:MAG: 3-dehydroquinate synthase [Planctomycetales bacterium]|nr:3-dehydroquinate synthase [Planctomycetales bacterium]